MTETWVWVGLLSMNLITFLTFGLDKRKALRKQWRIKESYLLLLSALGGSFGALVAIKAFRHKTKKTKFSLGVPLMLALHLGLIVLYYKSA